MIGSRSFPLAWLVLSLLELSAVGGCGDKSTNPPPVAGPTDPVPADGAADIPVALTLHWSPSALEGDDIRYRLDLGCENPPPLWAIGIPDTSILVRGLVFDTTCYWQVIAYTPQGVSARSAVWEFSTAADFVYPLAVDDWWDYDRLYYLLNPDPDTLTLPDTVFGTSNVRAVQIDTLQDTLEVFVLHTRWSEMGEVAQDAWDSHNNTPEGYLGYAYSGLRPPSPPKSAGSGVLFRGTYYPSVEALHVALLPELPPLVGVPPDTLIYEDPPVQILHYPLQVGQSWTFRPAGNPFRMDREVLGIERVTTPAGTFKCFKVCWYWDIDDDGEWDADISGFDLLAPVGVVRREFEILGIVRTSDFGDTVGVFDSREEFALTAWSLAP